MARIWNYRIGIGLENAGIMKSIDDWWGRLMNGCWDTVVVDINIKWPMSIEMEALENEAFSQTTMAVNRPIVTED